MAQADNNEKSHTFDFDGKIIKVVKKQRLNEPEELTVTVIFSDNHPARFAVNNNNNNNNNNNASVSAPKVSKRLVVIATTKNEAFARDVDTGETKQIFMTPAPISSSKITAIAYASERRSLYVFRSNNGVITVGEFNATVMEDGDIEFIHVWTSDNMDMRRSVKSVTNVACSTNGKMIALTDDDSVFFMDGLRLLDIGSRSKDITCVAISPNGEKFAYGTETGIVRTGDVETTNNSYTVAPMCNVEVTSILVDNDGIVHATVQRDHMTDVYLIKSKDNIRKITKGAMTCSSNMVALDTHKQLFGTDKGNIYRLNHHLHPARVYVSNSTPVKIIRVSQDGKHLVVVYENGYTFIHDITRDKSHVEVYNPNTHTDVIGLEIINF